MFGHSDSDSNVTASGNRRLPSPGVLLFCVTVLIVGAVVLRFTLRYLRQQEFIQYVEGLSGVVEVADAKPPWAHNLFVSCLGEGRARGFGEIDAVNLFMSDASDESLERLSEIRSLRRLNLFYAQIGDDGLQHLSRLDNLEYLNISGTQVTDVGLQHLSGLHKLKELELLDTQVSYDGVERLRTQLPDCEIHTGSTLNPL